MLREASRAALRGALRQIARVPFTRRGLHALSVATRGAGIAVLRARRVVPDTREGRQHPDRKAGSGLTPRELEKELLRAMGTLRFVHMSEAVELLANGSRIADACAVLIAHEVAHTYGLVHVMDDSDIMTPAPEDNRLQFGHADADALENECGVTSQNSEETLLRRLGAAPVRSTESSWSRGWKGLN